MPSPVSSAVRTAGLAELDAVERLERRCFTRDAQSRRSLRHLLGRAHADTLVLEDRAGGLAGYVLVLYRRGARVARLYSIAVDPDARGHGVAAALLGAAEAAAIARGNAWMRAEVRKSNAGSRALFASAGYRESGRLAAYYPGGEDGLRLQRRLVA